MKTVTFSFEPRILREKIARHFFFIDSYPDSDTVLSSNSWFQQFGTLLNSLKLYLMSPVKQESEFLCIF